VLSASTCTSLQERRLDCDGGEVHLPFFVAGLDLVVSTKVVLGCFCTSCFVTNFPVTALLLTVLGAISTPSPGMGQNQLDLVFSLV